MSENQQPGVPASAPERPALDQAYRQGYLAGHLAGWRDAVAAQPAPVAAPVPAPPGVSAQDRRIVAPSAATNPPTPRPRDPEAVAWPDHSALSAHPKPPAQPPFVSDPAQGRNQNFPPRGLPGGQQPPRVSHAPQIPAPPLDPKATAAVKNKRETQNINITLYVASLLMVAAAALFVGSNLPVSARLVGVWFGTSLFYAAGLVLHEKVARLKPAAVAFSGTALAIIPFAGLATYNLGVPNAPVVWLLTSFVGTFAYVFAAVRLQSRLVVYLSIAFLLSTAWSSVAVLGAALAWYFTALIVFSALLSLFGYLLKRNGPTGQRTPSLYAKPLSDLGPWFTPAGLAGSLAFGLALNAADHALVLVAGSVYYAVLTFISQPALRRYNYVGLRVSITMASPFVGWMIEPDLAWAAGAFAVVLAVQLIAVAYARTPFSVFLVHQNWIRRDVYISAPVLAAASLVWSVGHYFRQDSAEASTLITVLGVGFGLLATMLIVPAFLPRGEWLPLPAVGAVLLYSPLIEAAGWMVLVGLAVAYSVLRFLTTRTQIIRHVMLAAARILVTAFVASTLATFIPAQPGKTQLIIAVIAVIAALQLLADALLATYGAPNLIAGYSAAAWAVVGTFLVAGLSIAYSSHKILGESPSVVMGSLRIEFLVAAVAMAVAAAIFSLTKLTPKPGWSVGEFIAPSYLIITALFTGPVFAAGGASVAWTVALIFFISGGMRLRDRSGTLHRWLYWWAARVTSLLLSVALFQLWMEHDPFTKITGVHVGLGLWLLLALVPQLIILAVVTLRGLVIAGLRVDVILTLLIVVTVAGAAIRNGAPVLWTTMVVVGLNVAVLAILALAGTLRQRSFTAVQWGSPAAMVALAIWSAHDRGLLALVLVLIAGMSILVTLKARDQISRSAYFLLFRAAVTALVVVGARELTENLSVVSLIFSAVLLLQMAIAFLAQRVASFNELVGAPRLLQVGLWLLLGAQVLTPMHYHLAAGGFSSPGTALRWVVALELIALAVTAVTAQAALKQRGASYLALVAVVGGASVIAPVMWPGATALLLLALCIGVITWRCIYTPHAVEMRWYWLIATATFLVTASIVDRDAATGVFAAVWLVAGLALIVGAHVMKLEQLTLPGALMVFLAALLFRSQVLELIYRPGYAALAGFVVVVGSLYVVRLIFLDLVTEKHVQRVSVVGTALGAGAFFSLWSMADTHTVLAGAAGFTLIAVLACLEVPPAHRRVSIDTAILASAIVWFAACSRFVDLGAFWAIQWCAMALGALAVLRYVHNQQKAGRGLLATAASFASLGALVTIFSADSVQQIISLLVFVALLAVGMSLDERMFTVWGAIGVSTAVLWYLRGFTYILLALLALALIAFAIWRLNRKKPHLEPPVTGPMGNHGPPPGTPSQGSRVPAPPAAPPRQPQPPQ